MPTRTSGASSPDGDVTEAGYRLAHLDCYFKGRRLATIGMHHSEAYAVHRQGQGASNGSINRELAVLGRMLKLTYEHNRLARMPVLRKLEESSPRQGFFEAQAFGAVRRGLSDDLQVAVMIAYTFGWRMQSEVLALEQRQLARSRRTPARPRTARGEWSTSRPS